MITPSNPLNTPGFFELPALPGNQELLPGLLPQDITKVPDMSSQALDFGVLEQSMMSLLTEMMQMREQLEASFSHFLGAPNDASGFGFATPQAQATQDVAAPKDQGLKGQK